MRSESALLLLLAACETQPAERVESSVATAVAPVMGGAAVTSSQPITSVALDPPVRAWLRDTAVADQRVARRTLFSWTTVGSANMMRKTGRLLDDNAMPEGVPVYVQWLEYVAGQPRATGQLARLLLGHPDLKRRRYAWSRPWPTRIALGPRDYGDQLIQVELSPRAVFAVFDPQGAPIWRVYDLDHREVPLGRLLAEPDRLAAILHVQRGEPRYRELVLCNESMVESWSLATAEVQQVIAEDARQLRALARSGLPELLQSDRLDGDAALITAALAFHVPVYEPTPANMEYIASRLDEARQVGAPFSFQPELQFSHNAVPDIVRVRRLPPLRALEA
jgi:hypothetical protein